jgi:hypothetical protein
MECLAWIRAKPWIAIWTVGRKVAHVKGLCLLTLYVSPSSHRIDLSLKCAIVQWDLMGKES